jgi:hypothetical protein
MISEMCKYVSTSSLKRNPEENILIFAFSRIKYRIPQPLCEHEDWGRPKTNTEPGIWGKQNFCAKCNAVLFVFIQMKLK